MPNKAKYLPSKKVLSVDRGSTVIPILFLLPYLSLLLLKVLMFYIKIVRLNVLLTRTSAEILWKSK